MRRNSPAKNRCKSWKKVVEARGLEPLTLRLPA